MPKLESGYWNRDVLPEATDLNSARRDVDEFGYGIVRDALDPVVVSELRTAIDRIVVRETHDASAWLSNGNHRIFMLLNEGSEFVRLLESPIAAALVAHTVGPHALLSSLTANIARPGNSPQLLHADQQYVPEPWFCQVATNVVWVLDDFTAENGATRIVPRSHLVGVRPFSDDVPTCMIEAPAGSVICVDGRAWHGTGINRSTHSHRRAIFAYYCAPYIRQQENFCLSTDVNVVRSTSPNVRRLLGFDVWTGLGQINGLPREWQGTGRRTGPNVGVRVPRVTVVEEDQTPVTEEPTDLGLDFLWHNVEDYRDD